MIHAIYLVSKNTYGGMIVFQKITAFFSVVSVCCAFDLDNVCEQVTQDLLVKNESTGFMQIGDRFYNIYRPGRGNFTLGDRVLSKSAYNASKTAAPGMTPCVFSFANGTPEDVYISPDNQRDPQQVRANNEYSERLKELVVAQEQSNQLRKNPEVICTQLTRDSLRNKTFKFAGKNFSLSYQGDIPRKTKINEAFFLYSNHLGEYVCKVFVSYNQEKKELTVFIRP